MNSADRAKEFDALWRDSIVRAGRRPDWNDLSLTEQQAMSSQFRTEMDRYGDEDPTAGNRTGTGLYASPTSSRRPGSPPG